MIGNGTAPVFPERCGPRQKHRAKVVRKTLYHGMATLSAGFLSLARSYRNLPRAFADKHAIDPFQNVFGGHMYMGIRAVAACHDLTCH